MACDEALVERLQELVQGLPAVGEKRMFGGVCITLNGNMACGVATHELMLRLGEAKYAKALKEPHVREMDFTGRPMKGYVFVGQEGLKTRAQLQRWVNEAFEFVASLPPKQPKPAAVKATAKARAKPARKG